MLKIQESSQLSAIARLFSASVIQELARKGKSPLFARLVKQTNLLKITDLSKPVCDFFDIAFELLKKKDYRHEYIYKAAITHKILLGKHSLQTAVLLNEFRACNNKADTVILNGTSTVYEIKSERDSLTRLDQQIHSYRKVFANVNVIAGENHIDSILNIVPKDVGVLLLTNRFQISTIQEAIDSPSRTIPEAIFDSIQLKEAKRILKKKGCEIPELPNTKMSQALRQMFIKLSPFDAHNGMVETLRSTRSLLPLAEFVSELPKSLQAAALSTSIRKQDHIKLLAAINMPVREAIKWN